MNTGVVIAAGGIGKRMGVDLPKQLIEICGKPIIQHTFDRFMSAKISDLVVVAPSEWKSDIEKLLSGYPSSWKVVVGGERRQDSVLNGINALPETLDFVLIHDAARPFIKPLLIKKSIKALETHDAVLVALPAKDTIKEAKNNFVEKTIPREKIYQAQTPQGGKLKMFKNALMKATAITDDAQAFELIGVKPFIIDGDPWNFKITTKDDLIIAEAIARRVKEDENWHWI